VYDVYASHLSPEKLFEVPTGRPSRFPKRDGTVLEALPQSLYSVSKTIENESEIEIDGGCSYLAKWLCQ